MKAFGEAEVTEQASWEKRGLRASAAAEKCWFSKLAPASLVLDVNILYFVYYWVPKPTYLLKTNLMEQVEGGGTQVNLANWEGSCLLAPLTLFVMSLLAIENRSLPGD